LNPENLEHGPDRVQVPLPTPLRFILASGSAAGVNFGARLLLNFYLPYTVAIVIAFGCGLTTAFVLNRRFVFQDARNSLHQQMAWFVAINALALVQTLVVSLLLADYLLPRLGVTWHAREIAHAAGILVPIFTSYVGHKKWTFR